MAKAKRSVVGSVCKSKDSGKPDYIKVRDDLSLRKGQILRLESKKYQLDSLQNAVTAGKLSSELGEKIRERIEKIPDWVRFEIVAVEAAE
jgi:hypothetical protein